MRVKLEESTFWMCQMMYHQEALVARHLHDNKKTHDKFRKTPPTPINIWIPLKIWIQMKKTHWSKLRKTKIKRKRLKETSRLIQAVISKWILVVPVANAQYSEEVYCLLHILKKMNLSKT